MAYLWNAFYMYGGVWVVEIALKKLDITNYSWAQSQGADMEKSLTSQITAGPSRKVQTWEDLGQSLTSRNDEVAKSYKAWCLCHLYASKPVV